MEPHFVMNLWQAHKLPHDLAIEELYRTRGPVSLRFIQHIEAVQKHEKENSERRAQRELNKLLQKLLRPFIQHPLVAEWKKQYSEKLYGVGLTKSSSLVS